LPAPRCLFRVAVRARYALRRSINPVLQFAEVRFGFGTGKRLHRGLHCAHAFGGREQPRRDVTCVQCGLLQRIGHRAEGLIQSLARLRLRNVVAPCQLQPRQGQAVPYSGAVYGIGGSGLSPLGTGAGQGDEVGGEIAAVYGRYIARFQRLQMPRFVPVVKVTTAQRQSLHARQGCLQPIDRVEHADPAEIVGAGHADQVQTQIRRRSPVCHSRFRILLEIVRRQHIVFGGHIGFEVAPGPASDPAQLRVVRLRKRHATSDKRRGADVGGDHRAQHPQQQKGCSEPEGGRVSHRQQQRCEQRKHNGPAMLR
jgi:hypothetical protein